MELAPYCFAATGCQGIYGPLPSTFLDKNIVKNYCKDRVWLKKKHYLTKKNTSLHKAPTFPKEKIG
jgi:hypothetical protein